MLTFGEFLLEGGNATINGYKATKINLKEINRREIVRMLERSMAAINAHFKRFLGEPLWTKEVFKTKDFLSGSSSHFFNLNIPDDEFVNYKPLIGDIDTQVDASMASQVKNWLDSLGNIKLGYLTFLGYKSSAHQFITLWHLEKYNLNIQIDIELVEFLDKKPTPWAKFSHSSSWTDITLSVKGVFHKYLLRALTNKNIREINIQLKRKIKTVLDKDYSFSVGLGLRRKLEPIGDNLYRELSTKESKYITDLREIFKILLGKEPTKKELEDFGSFVGLLKLTKKYLNQKEIKNVVDSFAMLLWDKGAQGLVAGDPKEDYRLKRTAFDLMLKTLGMKEPPEIEEKIKEYYKNYK